MTDDENLAYETMRAALAAEERTTATLRAALKVAQGDEKVWAQYAAASMSDGDPADMAEKFADVMLAAHHKRWPRS